MYRIYLKNFSAISFSIAISTLHNYIGRTLARAPVASQLLPLKIVNALFYRRNTSEPELDDGSILTVTLSEVCRARSKLRLLQH
jgi:hypothetical protein